MTIAMRQTIEAWTEAGPCCMAEAEIGGRVYSARSRQASVELARRLVAAGIPDQNVEVRTTGICGRMDVSLFDLAGA